MKTRKMVVTICVLAAAMLLLFSAAAPLAASNVPPTSSSASIFNDPPPPPPSEGPEAVHNPGPSEVEIMGTMWQPQNSRQFKEWIVYGWGTFMRLKPAKAPSDEWVHISPTKVNTLNGAAQKISYVSVCGATSNPTVTRPTQLHMWAENNNRFYTGGIAWSNTTARQCKTVTFPPATFKLGLNISILIHFGNGTDTVTMQEVWVGTTD